MKDEIITREIIDYMYDHYGTLKNKDRDKAIAEMRLSGAVYEDIGKAFGLSANRCREIVVRMIRRYNIFNKTQPKTNYERIKAMSLDEMAQFFGALVNKNIIETADSYICNRCRKNHGGHCPIKDDDKCIYDMDDVSTMKLWLGGDAE